ncbi:MAG: acyl-CoA dehydrogenase [Dermatophilaceae bacterium]
MIRPSPWLGAFEALDRPEPLDVALGDPADRDNPTGVAAFVRADDDGELLFEAERALDAFGLGLAFVPASLGGWLQDCAELGRSLRPLFRRDVAVALGHGASNLVGAVNVWATGSPDQQRWLAEVLARNGRVAAAYTDLASGNDAVESRLQAPPTASGYLLRGSKDIVNNVTRAEAITVLARTRGHAAMREHSLLLLPRRELPMDRVRLSARVRTSAVRAMYLGGIEFDSCPAPSRWLVGEEGRALETMLRTFQVSRAVLISGALGAADTQLRTVTEFAQARALYRHRVSEFPHARRVLARAFADLLLCDAFATVVCRALHLAPRHTCVLAAAVKYAVPAILRDTVEDLALVLGARSFLREGPHAIFQKHLRDLPVAAMVHGGEAVCLATMIPPLSRVAEDPTTPQADPAGAGALFRLGERLEPLQWQALAVYPPRGDPVTGQVSLALENPLPRRLVPVVRRLAAELVRVRAEARSLPPTQRGLRAGAGSFALARRYALLAAAGAALGVWCAAASSGDVPPLLADTAWVEVALRGVCRRLGVPGADDDEAAVEAEAALTDEVMRRVDGHAALDLTGRTLCHDDRIQREGDR